MFINSIYPVILFILTSLTLLSKRRESTPPFTFAKHFCLTALLLLPWVSLLYFHVADMWIIITQGVIALLLLLFRSDLGGEESWIKGVFSFFMGFVFLELSIHPAVGLPFPISTEIAQSVTASSFLIGIFLLFGLPPLQLGMADLGSLPGSTSSLALNLITRYAVCFVILTAINQSRWIENIAPLHGFVAGIILLGLGVTRLVLRLQSNIFRLLNYLFAGLAMSFVIKLCLPELGDIYFFIVTLALVPFFFFLNRESPAASEGYDLLNWTSYSHYHALPASRFKLWLRVFLYTETLVALLLAVYLFTKGQWVLGLASCFGSFCSFAVNRDEKAFGPQEKAHIRALV